MKINTNLFPIISVGMYYSRISPDSIFDDYQINDDLENGYINYSSDYFWDNFDNNKYVKDIERIACSFLDGEHEVDGVKVTIKCGEIYSPKYYNFETDQIDMDVEYNKDELLSYAHKNKDEFNEFLKDNYSSYDGFTSFTANNYNDWVSDFRDDNEQSVGAVLTYLFRDEEMQSQFEDEVYGNVFYDEYFDSSEYDEIYNIIVTYVNEHYPHLNKDICPIENDNIDVMSIYKKCIDNIESKTLKLEL